MDSLVFKNGNGESKEWNEETNLDKVKQKRDWNQTFFHNALGKCILEDEGDFKLIQTGNAMKGRQVWCRWWGRPR
jgi:hypothetical protein